MAKVITRGVNTLPRLSYRWLKLNDLKLKKPVQFPLQPYTLEYMGSNNLPGVTLRKISKDNLCLPSSSTQFGVSQELVSLGEENYNSGFELRVSSGTKLSEPLVFRYEFGNGNNSVNDYNIIVAEKNSSVTINIEYVSTDATRSYHNGVTKIIAEEGAEVNLVKVQRLNDESLNFDSHYVELEPYATVRYIQVELGSQVTATNYLANLAENSNATVDGMYFGDGQRILDLSYHMIHQGFRSNSDILVKGALQDQSKKVFRGTLDFKRGAYLSNGNEEEYVLLLDPTVKSDAVPLLLSEEDDVQGGHAASAGKVDEDQLFYLLTRGLTPKDALETIVKASFQPVLDQLPAQQYSAILADLEQRLVAKNV